VSFTHEDGTVLNEYVWFLIFSFCFGLKRALNMRFDMLKSVIIEIRAIWCVSPCSVVYVPRGTHSFDFGVEELQFGKAC
jgi:hypothetical protein